MLVMTNRNQNENTKKRQIHHSITTQNVSNYRSPGSNPQSEQKNFKLSYVACLMKFLLTKKLQSFEHTFVCGFCSIQDFLVQCPCCCPMV